MKYTLAYTPTKPKDGHKVFLDEAGLVVLADWSGHYPDQTEDGPLYVDASRVMTITLHRDELICCVPVRSLAHEPYGVWTTAGTARHVLSRIAIQYELGPLLIELIKKVHHLGLLETLTKQVHASSSTGLPRGLIDQT